MERGERARRTQAERGAAAAKSGLAARRPA